VPATVSVGAALWSPGQELEDVISRSGRALYAAKTGGRGKIVVDGEDGATAGDAQRAPEADQLRELDEG
jgi:predicted signal transduction protein with EAL and GGDEF domain